MARRWFSQRDDTPDENHRDHAEEAERAFQQTRDEIRQRELARREVEIAAKTETIKALKAAGYEGTAETVGLQLTDLIKRVAVLVDQGQEDSLERELLEIRMRALYETDDDREG